MDNLYWQFEGLQYKKEVLDYFRWHGNYEDLFVNNSLYDDKFSFEWGADKIGAREALISILEKANTTLTWRVDCDENPNQNKNAI